MLPVDSPYFPVFFRSNSWYLLRNVVINESLRLIFDSADWLMSCRLLCKGFEVRFDGVGDFWIDEEVFSR